MSHQTTSGHPMDFVRLYFHCHLSQDINWFLWSHCWSTGFLVAWYFFLLHLNMNVIGPLIFIHYKKKGAFQSLGWYPLEKVMATYSSIPDWRIPWTEEADRLQCTGSQSVRYNWSNLIQDHSTQGEKTHLNKQETIVNIHFNKKYSKKSSSASFQPNFQWAMQPPYALVNMHTQVQMMSCISI